MTSAWDAARRHFGTRLHAWRDTAGDQQATLDGTAIAAVRARALGEPVDPIVRSVADQVVAAWQHECRQGPPPGLTSRAVSVATETAGHKISRRTQGDSDFPRFKDRGKRAGAVSVATETAGHKISRGTQGDSDFPRFKDRGKRAGAVSVATETAGHKISLGTQGDSDFPRFKDRGKRSSAKSTGEGGPTP